MKEVYELVPESEDSKTFYLSDCLLLNGQKISSITNRKIKCQLRLFALSQSAFPMFVLPQWFWKETKRTACSQISTTPALISRYNLLSQLAALVWWGIWNMFGCDFAQIPDWVSPIVRCLNNSMFFNFKDQYNGILLNYHNIILCKFYQRHKN